MPKCPTPHFSSTLTYERTRIAGGSTILIAAEITQGPKTSLAPNGGIMAVFADFLNGRLVYSVCPHSLVGVKRHGKWNSSYYDVMKSWGHTVRMMPEK